LVADLRARSGANIVIIDGDEKPISAEKISIDLADVPWRDALDLVAEKSAPSSRCARAGVLAVTRLSASDFEFPNADIRQVIDTIAKYGSANIVMAPEVTGTISVRFKGVPWREALDVVAKTLNFTVVRGRARRSSARRRPGEAPEQLGHAHDQFRYLRPKSLYKPVIKSGVRLRIAAAEPAGSRSAADHPEDVAKSRSHVLQALSKA
jgi:type II secretory pathway component GspD/PulD (secretin)